MKILFNVLNKSSELKVVNQGLLTLNGKTYRIVVKQGGRELTNLQSDVRKKIAEKTLKILQDVKIEKSGTLEDVKVSKTAVHKGSEVLELLRPKLHKKRFEKLESFVEKGVPNKPHKLMIPHFTDEVEKQAAYLHKEFIADKRKFEIAENNILCSSKQLEEAVLLATQHIAEFNQLSIKKQTIALQIIMLGRHLRYENENCFFITDGYDEGKVVSVKFFNELKAKSLHKKFKEKHLGLLPVLERKTKSIMCRYDQLQEAVGLARKNFISHFDALEDIEATHLIQVILTGQATELKDGCCFKFLELEEKKLPVNVHPADEGEDVISTYFNQILEIGSPSVEKKALEACGAFFKDNVHRKCFLISIKQSDLKSVELKFPITNVQEFRIMVNTLKENYLNYLNENEENIKRAIESNKKCELFKKIIKEFRKEIATEDFESSYFPASLLKLILKKEKDHYPEFIKEMILLSELKEDEREKFPSKFESKDIESIFRLKLVELMVLFNQATTASILNDVVPLFGGIYHLIDQKRESNLPKSLGAFNLSMDFTLHKFNEESGYEQAPTAKISSRLNIDSFYGDKYRIYPIEELRFNWRAPKDEVEKVGQLIDPAFSL